MLINLRNALMAGKRLPYDAEVEYLESTGTQWIDTGLDYFADFEIGIKLRTSVPNKALGTSINTCLQRYSANNPYWELEISGRSYRSRASIVDYHVMSWKSGVFATDGVSEYTVSNPFASGTMTLFGAGGFYFPNIIYACKLWDANGTLVCDFIPVRKGTVGYLYDRVSGKLFGNAGTGDFVVGQDVVPATFVDGEYWNTFGVATALSGASRCDNFIPVQPSSSVTFYLGAHPGGTTLYMVQYNANKKRENSTYNSNGSARTVTVPANCYYIRVSAETAKKNEAYIHDNTNDRELLRNGMIPTPA